jgi:hypothetical protein
MQREALRQRIRYLLEHGGTYPEHPPDRTRWLVFALLVAIAAMEAIELLL